MERVRQQEAYRQRKVEEFTVSHPKPLDGGPALEQAREAPVQVISGASVQTLTLAGLQVAQARELVATILRIDPRAPVLVNGLSVRPDYRLASGDTLEFVHQAGEKGGGYGTLH